MLDHLLPLHFDFRTRLFSTRILFVAAILTTFLTLPGCVTGDQTGPNGRAQDNKSESKKSGLAESSNKTPEEWRARMQALSNTLSELLPIVISNQKYADPANNAKVDAEVKTLKGLAHGLKKDAIAPNADPSLAMMADLFEEDLSRASSALASGHREYARGILRDTTAYCFQCHTQTNNGPNFPKLALNIDLTKLSPIERGEFYAATRQFDPAVKEFTKVIEDKTFAKEDSSGWEKAARAAVAITVKVNKNPSQVLTLTEKILANPSSPQFVQSTIRPWLESARNWKREKKVLLRSPQEQLRQAEKLIETAQKLQTFPMDHSQDILYFRAGSILHDFLSVRRINDESSAKALFLSGIAAEQTRDMNFWTLHERYFEKCIQAAPGTNISRQCFDRLNDSVTAGYTGSSGTMIPPDVSNRIDVFKRLSARPAVPGGNTTQKPPAKSEPEKP